MESLVNLHQASAPKVQQAACTVVLTVPKLAITAQSCNSSDAWGRCLHQGYAGGWVIIGSHHSTAPRAIGKPIGFFREHGIIRVPLHFLLVQQPSNPEVWLRGALDETMSLGSQSDEIRPVINLDGRASPPDTTSGRPCGWLGSWPIKFVVRNCGSWQYREICQIITRANQSLPSDLQISLANENCLDPHRLWMPNKSIVGFDIGGAK